MHLSRRISAAARSPWAPYVVALAVQLVFIGYVKDDAYIEYRFATNLAPSTAWFPLSNSVVSNNGQFSVTVPLESGSLFFRLSTF